MQSNELYHHGILGQKWGNRNGPPYPLGSGEHSKSEVRAGWRASLKKNSASRAEKKEHKERVREQMAKDTAKDLMKSNPSLSEKDAISQAEKNNARLKTMAAVGLTVAAAGGAFIAYKYINANSDSIIRAGSEIQRITNRDTLGETVNLMYAAKTPTDKVKYAGMYATQLLNSGSEKIYKTTYGAEKDIKIAGLKTTKKVFDDLMDGNPEFKAAANRCGFFNHDAFNQRNFLYNMQNDPTYGADTKQLSKIFTDQLKEMGFGGFIDVNDVNYSGYKATKPTILFEDGIGALKTKSVGEIPLGDIKRNNAFATAEIIVEQMISDPQSLTSFGYLGTVGGGVYAYKRKKAEKELKKQ